MSDADKPGKSPATKSQTTRAVRAGLESDAQYGSVVPPVYLSTNFAYERYLKPRKYDYTRSGNRTYRRTSRTNATLNRVSTITPVPAIRRATSLRRR